MQDYSPLVYTRTAWRSAARTTVALLACLVLEVVTSRELSSRTSTTVLTQSGDQHRPPLAVLKSNPSDGSSASSVPDLRIFAEDPQWESKVEDFVLAAGVEGDGVDRALSGVRDVAWAAGRTLRAKYMVLLASAEDAEFDDGEGPACRLTDAVVAASKHTSDAHFILVANGFELTTKTRVIVEHSLGKGRWTDLTVIELPEFEGFSSAFNRAMGSIETLGNPVVAVVSTSMLLVNVNAGDLPPVSTGTAEASLFSSPKTDTEEEFVTRGSSGGRADDIFVAYERLLHASAYYIATSTYSMPAPRGDTSASSSAPSKVEARSGSPEGDYYFRGGGGCSGLLVTASPSPRLPARGGDGKPTDATATGSADTKSRRNSTQSMPQSSSVPITQTAHIRLSDIAPLPLLVFDTKTFSVLGGLEEGFFFQGGVADWISRARPWRRRGDTLGVESSTHSCCRSRKQNIFVQSKCAHGEPPTLHRSDGGVRRVHEQEWARRFVRAWTATREEREQFRDDVGLVGELDTRTRLDDADGGDSNAEPRMSSTQKTSIIGEGQNVKGTEGMVDTEVLNQQYPGRQSNRRSVPWGLLEGKAAMDQWNRLPAVRLQALVQADADLFFLPLLLLKPSAGVYGSAAAAAATRCVDFHANWMGRGPDNVLVEEASARREKFPVAAVVVVHDDISLMRATLEEVASVVEYILVLVSATPWHGSTKDITPTLELLETLREDVNSPTHGKIQIELGNWSSEEEQREHGNSLIKADPRGFARILVIDTDEFWHPVELTKALILAARNPRTAYFRAEMATYWASLRSVVTPPEMLRVLWLVDPHRCRWFRNRETECTVDADNPHPGLDIDNTVAVVHHLSYVRTEEGLRRKMETFSHAGEEKNEWYERSWLGWAANHTLTDLHPTAPEAFKRVRSQPLFDLTPSLRTLYLDAKKGRTVGSRNDTTAARAPTSSLKTSEHAIPRSNTDGIAKKRNASGGGGNLYNGRGCEGTPPGKWTEFQRTMCLVPDVDGGASQPIRGGQAAASIFGRNIAQGGDYDRAPEAAIDEETRAYEGAGKMDNSGVEGAAKERGGLVERNGLRVEIARPRLGEVFGEEEILLDFSISGERREECMVCLQINEHASCEPISSSPVYLGGLTSGSHAITVKVLPSHEANKTTRNRYTSSRVVASDTVVVDVVGPDWHGAAEIERLTTATRGLASYGRGGSIVGQTNTEDSSHDIGEGLHHIFDDPDGGINRQMTEVDKFEGVLRVAILSNTLEGHSQNRAFGKLARGLPRSRYDVEWFTTQAPAAASLEPLWTRLTSSLVPVRAVSIPNDPVRATKVLNDIAIARSSSHLFKYAGGQEIGDEEPRGGRGMPLAEYVAELSNFDVVLCANSLEILDAKVLMAGALLARRPIRVVVLCNVEPPRDLHAEAFLAPSAYVASHPSVSILQLPTAIIYPAALRPNCWRRQETGSTERRSSRRCGDGTDNAKDGAERANQMQPTIRIGFVGRLSSARSPGLFLHAAKHLLASLSSGTLPTKSLSSDNEIISAKTTRSDAIDATVAACTANASAGCSDASVACSNIASRDCAATEASSSPGAARLHDNAEISTAATTAVAASAAVADRMTFVVAGSGPLADHLGALAQELGLSDRVEFVGAVEESDMSAFLRSLDMVINPAVCETFGIANAEASAVGIPAVGFASCGILESTSANRDLAAWPPSALGLAQSTARLLFAKGYLGSTGNTTTDAGSGRTQSVPLGSKEEAQRDFTLDTFIKRHDTFLTAMVRRKRRATQDASEKNPTNARSHKSSDTNEAITTPLSTPVKNQATVAQTADYTGLQQREGDIVGIVEPTDDVSNLSVLVSGASLGDDVGSDTGVPSRTRQDLGGGIGTVVVGFSPGTAYLEAFLKRVFTKVFYWVDKVEVLLDPDPDLAPAVYVVGALDGVCGSSWEKRCQDRTTALAERYRNALVVFVNGESSDVSALNRHQASAAFLTTTSPGKRPREVPSFHLPNLVTSFGERRTHSSSDLLQCRRRDRREEMGNMNASSEGARKLASSVAYMYSRCDRPMRQEFFDLLIDRGVSVDALGACRGQRTPDLPHLRQGRFRPFWHDDAVEAYRKYGLVIAFENSDDPGYVTEKLANAFLSGAVPVYWGTADASQVFNPESFIHCGEFPSLAACADRVAEVAGNESLWEQYHSQPCVRDDDRILEEWLLVWRSERPAEMERGSDFSQKNGRLEDWLLHTLRSAAQDRHHERFHCK